MCNNGEKWWSECHSHSLDYKLTRTVNDHTAMYAAQKGDTLKHITSRS